MFYCLFAQAGLLFNRLAHGKMLDDVLPFDFETPLNNLTFERTITTTLLVLCGITSNYVVLIRYFVSTTDSLRLSYNFEYNTDSVGISRKPARIFAGLFRILCSQECNLFSCHLQRK